MSIATSQSLPVTQPQGPKFFVNVEGVEFPWDHDTITVPEIRKLGSLPTDMPVLEINLEDNTERTLSEDEVVKIKPGHGFSKKVKYQRGCHD